MKQSIDLQKASINDILEEIDHRIGQLTLAKNKILNVLNNDQYKQFTNFSTRINDGLYIQLKKYCDKNDITISSLLKSYILQSIDHPDMYLGEYIDISKQYFNDKPSRTIAIALDDDTAQHFKFLMSAYNKTLQDYVMAFIGKALSNKTKAKDYIRVDKHLNRPFKPILKDCIGNKQYIDIVTTERYYKRLVSDNNLYLDIKNYIFNVGNDSSGKPIKENIKYDSLTTNDRLSRTISISIDEDRWEHFVDMCKNYHILPSKCLINWFAKKVSNNKGE